MQLALIMHLEIFMLYCANKSSLHFPFSFKNSNMVPELWMRAMLKAEIGKTTVHQPFPKHCMEDESSKNLIS